MAAIDHSVIVFKNGEWTKETWKYDDDGEYVSSLPFDYTRDGNIISYTVNNMTVMLHGLLKWHVDEYNALYRRTGIKKLYSLKNPYCIWSRIKWALRLKERNYGAEYTHKIGVYENDMVRVYIYHDVLKQSYISFFVDDKDSYVVLGGYGHNENVYVHFMHRGYGDEFEAKMTKEALRWCTRNPLYSVAEIVNETDDDVENWYDFYEELFLKRKD